jgi:hypothetical protein
LRISFFCYLLCISSSCIAQQDSIADSNHSRKWISAGIHATAYGGSLLVLNEAWYKDYARRSLHSFDDSREWQQVDKLGHAWGAYHVTKGSAALWKWSGLNEHQATWIGGLSSLGYLTIIEFLDARSVKWGWSWADMAANVLGSGLYITQQTAWNEQKIQFKFSFHGKKYDPGELNTRADELYGKSWYERMLKDYNGQTYWLSLNLRSVLKNSNLPGWIDLSLGYGADGMYGGFGNQWTDKAGIVINRSDIPRIRQFYLSPDIDLTKIKTNSRFLRTVLSALNGFKFPAPALMINSKGKLKIHPIYF